MSLKKSLLVSTSIFYLLALTGCPVDVPVTNPKKVDMSQDMTPDGGQNDEGPALTITTANASATTGQAPLEIAFNGDAMGGQAPYKFTWNFGDDSTAVDGKEVKHTYLRGGTFTARLTATDAAGSSDTKDITIELDAPIAPVITQIIAAPTSGIAPLAVSFQATVTNANEDLGYAWDFGDGNTSENKSPTHTYQSSGNFTATLIIKDKTTNQTSAPAATNIQVASDAQPAAASSATPQSGIVPLTVSFRGTVVGGNDPFSYEWNFGDGAATVNTQNPSHTYTTPGSYTALFTVTDADGDKNTSMVEIKVQTNSAPQVNIKATPSMGLAPLSVQLDPQTQGGDQPLSYVWQMGDGTTSTQASPNHIYQMAGTYTAAVTVTDANGDKASGMVDIVVNTDDIPTVTASATPTMGLAPLQTQLTAVGQGGNGALTYAWNFGDGDSANGRSVNHTYQNAGQYQATVTVTDADGDVSSTQITIDVGSDLVPSANASGSPTTGFAPLAVNFFGNANGGNAPLTYSWNFGDGSASSTMQNPAHTYANTGTFTATLVVTDADGDSSSDTVRIEILSNAVPVVTASATPNSGIAPFNVAFMASVTSGDAPFTYEWNFGDGAATSNLQNPNHSYTTGGTFTATVTVTDDNGDTDSDTVQINVADDAQPVVTASSDKDTGTAPMSVNFSAVGAGGNGNLSYQWFFGDGTAPAMGATTTHTYLNPGIYEATVVVTDADGDSSDDKVTINVLDMAPDLKVESFTITTNGDDVTYEVIIKNVGVIDATSNFTVRFYDDLAQAPDATTPPSTSRSVSVVIPPQGLHTVTATRFDQPFGVYDGWVFVDPLRENPDLDRTNNFGGPNQYDVDGLVINEVFYDSIGADVGTFVELYGRPGKDVSGYVLEEINGSNGAVDAFTIPANTTIPLDGHLVIGDGTTPNEDINSGTWSDLQNGAESLILKDTNGNIVDAMGWGDHSSTMHFSGEGSATTDVTSGYSLGRDSLSKDTGDNLDDFYIWNIPTPGEVNLAKMTNNADTCADPYLISNNQSGKFIVEADLFGTTNNYTALDTSAPNCSATSSTLGGVDQILSFVVPANRTASVTLNFGDTAPFDLDAVLTKDPCSSLNTGLVGCNFVGQDIYNNLGPGTYYLVVLEDSSTSNMFTSAPYIYKIDLTFTNGVASR